MKLRVRNVDNEPFLVELDLVEAGGTAPCLWIRHFGDDVLAVAVRPDGSLELRLAAEHVTLKRETVRAWTDEAEETLISTDTGLGPASGPLGTRPSGERAGLLSRLAGRGGKGPTPVRIRIADTGPSVLETVLPVGQYKGGAFEGTLLSVYRHRDGIVTFSKPGPMLDVFLKNGTAWHVGDGAQEKMVMSTERAQFRVRRAERLSGEAQQERGFHFGLPS